MEIFKEVWAIIWLVIMFALKAEVETPASGAGEAKKEQVIKDVLVHLQSPGGLYVDNKWVLWAVETALRVFLIDFIVAQLKNFQGKSFLGFSPGSFVTPKK